MVNKMFETLWNAKWLSTLYVSYRRAVHITSWRIPPSVFMRAVRLAEKWIQAKLSFFIKRSHIDDQAIISFRCLIGDMVLEMDGFEAVSTASAAARKGTNCFLIILGGHY